MRILSLGLFWLSLSASAQLAPSIAWQNALGGSANESGYDIQQTADGGYIMVGQTFSNDGDVSGNHGSYDVWAVKLDDMGNLTWQKALGGANIDVANAVQQTSDGGYIMVGLTFSNDGDVSGNHGQSDVWVVKLDDLGNLSWQKTLGGSGDDHGWDIQQTSDGGYIAVGTTMSNNGDVSGNHGGFDVWVVKLDMMGNFAWQKAFGGISTEFGQAIGQSIDGGYILVGLTYSNDGDVSGNHGSSDVWIIKLDETGNLIWQKTLGGSGEDSGNAILQTSDGGYTVTGYTESNDGDVSGNHGGFDAWVVKLDIMGNFAWQKAFGGSGMDKAVDIEQTSDGGYIMTGFTESNDGDISGNYGSADMWVLKVDVIGNLLWQKTLGGANIDIAYAVQQTSDEGFILAGSSDSNNGHVFGNHGLQDTWVVKLGLGTVGLDDGFANSFTIAPNPTHGSIRVTSASPMRTAITLNDALGREVLRETMVGKTATLDLSGYPRGLYLLTLLSAEGNQSERLVLE